MLENDGGKKARGKYLAENFFQVVGMGLRNSTVLFIRLEIPGNARHSQVKSSRGSRKIIQIQCIIARDRLRKTLCYYKCHNIPRIFLFLIRSTIISIDNAMTGII